MAKIKVLLICGQGMSTSLFAQKIIENLDEDSVLDIHCCDLDMVYTKSLEHDILLFAPQVAYLVDNVVSKSKKVFGILARDVYSKFDVDAVLIQLAILVEELKKKPLEIVLVSGNHGGVMGNLLSIDLKSRLDAIDFPEYQLQDVTMNELELEMIEADVLIIMPQLNYYQPSQRYLTSKVIYLTREDIEVMNASRIFEKILKENERK